MNKSVITNLLCLGIALAGHAPQTGAIRDQLLAIGYFGLSGALTNWLAVHMLFERVPGLYGSGIIPLKFEAFKSSIEDLIMLEFFSEQNIAKFTGGDSEGPDLEPIVQSLDYGRIFDGFLEAVAESKFGGMLAMVGGPAVLKELRAPFAEKMKARLLEMSQSPEFHAELAASLAGRAGSAGALGAGSIRDQIAKVVQLRLDELTPGMVKEIVQNMIRSHLGWLVVWGGVFGGLIGLMTSFLR